MKSTYTFRTHYNNEDYIGIPKHKIRFLEPDDVRDYSKDTGAVHYWASVLMGGTWYCGNTFSRFKKRRKRYC